MNELKRICLIILSVLILCSNVFAEELEINTTIPTKEIKFLQENNVIVGDPDGYLRENDQITRAEFVTILCRAIGIEELARSEEMKNKEIYVDVPKTHWAIGYINAATEYGAINGVGNGFFCPEMSVTNEQAIKILVAAWGYTEEAKKLGGYPNGYMAIAQQFGITDSVLINYRLASRRWVVSVFTYNMLSVMPNEVELDLVALTKIEKPEKPIGENGLDYIKNPTEILEQITPETVAYERKIFEQRVPEGESVPLEIKENIVVYTGDNQYDSATLSVGKPSEKGRDNIDLKKSNKIDISDYSEGEYQIIATFRKNNVVDSYYADLIIADDTPMLGQTFRITYLRHQPIIDNQNAEISFDSTTDNDLPFDMIVDSDKNGKIVLCINYPNVLSDGAYFSYDIVSEQLETIEERIDGKNKIIEPILVDNLKMGQQYSVAIGLYEKNGNHNIIKGNFTLDNTNGKAIYKFEGNHSVVTFKGYRIGE